MYNYTSALRTCPLCFYEVWLASFWSFSDFCYVPHSGRRLKGMRLLIPNPWLVSCSHQLCALGNNTGQILYFIHFLLITEICLMNGRHWDPYLSLKEFDNWNTPTSQGRHRAGANIHYAGHFNSTSILCAQIWVSHLLAQPGAPDVQIQRSCKGSLTQSSPAILIIKSMYFQEAIFLPTIR